jgi:hypothetical protein
MLKKWMAARVMGPTSKGVTIGGKPGGSRWSPAQDKLLQAFEGNLWEGLC